MLHSKILEAYIDSKLILCQSAHATPRVAFIKPPAPPSPGS